MVIVHLVLQPLLCGIGCRQILFGVLLYHTLFVQHHWMAPANKGTLLNVH